MRTRTLATAIAVASACLVGGLAPIAVAAPAKATPSKPKVASDFNGDGYGDLVVNQNAGTVGGKAEAGAVVVLYGSKDGVNPAKRQVITQNTPGVPGTAEGYDRFGAQTVSGDYDADGYTDLAISASGEDITFGTTYRRNAGQLAVVWGGKKGLTQHGATTVKQTTPTGADVRRGSSLAAGDFNGDGRTDLATADYSAGRGGEVLYGPISRTGTPKSTINLGLKEGGVGVHTALDAGDLTGDGISDLVVQVFSGRGEHINLSTRIELQRGTKKGLVRIGKLTDAKDKWLVNWGATDDHLAVGDVNKDGHADIALGREMTTGYPQRSGEVTVVFGGPQGQSTSRAPQVITQDTFGVPDISEHDDYFGAAVAMGDTNADGYADLAVGAPTESIDDKQHAGQVTTILGGGKGLSSEGARLYHQGTPGMPTAPAAYDFFGSAVKLVDLNGDRRADLAVGSDGDEMHKGRVSVVPAAGSGANSAKAVAFTAPGIGLTEGYRTGFGTSFGH
ncbi:VCBS repeat-containing protein [Streptomyces sp. NPDC020965]|uniref:VCBS repeat-containing protein n=1 Tax=Streptomyces sp. NPDC020965 TaxID=3365105 RepID=UPI00378FE4BD